MFPGNHCNFACRSINPESKIKPNVVELSRSESSRQAYKKQNLNLREIIEIQEQGENLKDKIDTLYHHIDSLVNSYKINQMTQENLDKLINQENLDKLLKQMSNQASSSVIIPTNSPGDQYEISLLKEVKEGLNRGLISIDTISTEYPDFKDTINYFREKGLTNIQTAGKRARKTRKRKSRKSRSS
jgi:TolA-binding protein